MPCCPLRARRCAVFPRWLAVMLSLLLCVKDSGTAHALVYRTALCLALLSARFCLAAVCVPNIRALLCVRFRGLVVPSCALPSFALLRLAPCGRQDLAFSFNVVMLSFILFWLSFILFWLSERARQRIIGIYKDAEKKLDVRCLRSAFVCPAVEEASF
jgi:hypothetical protein